MSKKNWIVIFCVVIILLVIGMFLFNKTNEDKKEENNEKNESEIVMTENFNIEIIKQTFAEKNYLISPYSIEIALNMLRDGASGNTKKELDNVIGNRQISFLNIKDKLNVANALFIGNRYKNNVLNSYYDRLTKNYGAEVLYDEFQTPDVINKWVNDKTNGMIPKILDNISSDFVLGLANAVAMDVKWQKEFECNNTRSSDFTKVDGNHIQVEMMHNDYYSNTMYLLNDEVKGIVLPYQSDNVELEFIGLLPKESLDVFINNLTDDKLNKIITSFTDVKDNEKLKLSLPRFTYGYEIENFIDVLMKMGIKDAFNSEKADFTRMINVQAYVNEAIHKTKIELNEKGTKAAAVTYFGMVRNSAPESRKNIDITFDKPFIYLIREKKSNELLFFGAVYEPTIWTKTTCE